MIDFDTAPHINSIKAENTDTGRVSEFIYAVTKLKEAEEDVTSSKWQELFSARDKHRELYEEISSLREERKNIPNDLDKAFSEAAPDWELGQTLLDIIAVARSKYDDLNTAFVESLDSQEAVPYAKAAVKAVLRSGPHEE